MKLITTIGAVCEYTHGSSNNHFSFLNKEQLTTPNWINNCSRRSCTGRELDFMGKCFLGRCKQGFQNNFVKQSPKSSSSPHQEETSSLLTSILFFNSLTAVTSLATFLKKLILSFLAIVKIYLSRCSIFCNSFLLLQRIINISWVMSWAASLEPVIAIK